MSSSVVSPTSPRLPRYLPQSFSSEYWSDDDFRFGEASFTPGQIIREHAHDDAYLCLVLEGGYSEALRHRSLHLSTGAVYFMPAERAHETAFGGVGAFLFRVSVSSSALSKFRDQGIRVDAPWYRPGGDISWAMATLYRDARAATQTADDIRDGVIEALSRGPFTARRTGTPLWLAATRDALEEERGPHTKIAELAASVGVHPVSLVRAFRTRYGCTPGEFLQTRRVVRACSLLTRTAMSVGGIAAALGYHDQSHLVRMFKARIGITPTEFRRRSRRR